MKLNVHKDGQPVRQIEGTEARSTLRGVMQNVTKRMLLPIPEAGRRLRRRMIQRLRDGEAIWDGEDKHGHGHPAGTILTMPQRIAGIIKPDGTFEPAPDATPQEIAEMERMLAERKQAIAEAMQEQANDLPPQQPYQHKTP